MIFQHLIHVFNDGFPRNHHFLIQQKADFRVDQVINFLQYQIDSFF